MTGIKFEAVLIIKNRNANAFNSKRSPMVSLLGWNKQRYSGRTVMIHVRTTKAMGIPVSVATVWNNGKTWIGQFRWCYNTLKSTVLGFACITWNPQYFSDACTLPVFPLALVFSQRQDGCWDGRYCAWTLYSPLLSRPVLCHKSL